MKTIYVYHIAYLTHEGYGRTPIKFGKKIESSEDLDEIEAFINKALKSKGRRQVTGLSITNFKLLRKEVK
ncbi:hypothetical protein KAR91_09740 [Candidatus Pacearchaeota archaeon]|nr:hypothetical protein [Candidatus Pacearchaeota archaeon]